MLGTCWVRAPEFGGFILRNNHKDDITWGFCPEAGFPLCCRFISEELFQDLLSPNGYISGAHNFYLVSIVHTILPSFTLPPTAPGHKKKNPGGLSNIPPYT
jgi:hypothetical protein